jgi:toluene monooxygenase system protein A
VTLRREEWLDLARKVDWTYRYVTEEEIFPEAVSGSPWLTHEEAWADWSEVYRTTFSEYVRNQSAKDHSVLAVRDALTKSRANDRLDRTWLQLVKFHQGAFALAEYAAVAAELRMARFGRDSAWRIMANLGALDEIRHSQIPLLLGHDLLELDDNFDWTHKAFHTNNFMMIAARHFFDDAFGAANAIDMAVQLNFVLETGFTNLQFMALAAMANRVDHHVFETALASIQTDEARHAQIGHPVVRALIDHGAREHAQYLLDKTWWRSWRLLIATTGTAMEYLTPVAARTRSFKEFVHEWIVEQFLRNLDEFQLDLPWFWDQFLEEVDFAHHSLQLVLYTYRPMLWFDEPTPSAPERAWLREKYPDWSNVYEPIWDRIEQAWERDGEAATLAYGLPAMCNLCQLPAAFVRPGDNRACTLLLDRRTHLFCSEPCRWIFEQQSDRFSDHRSIVDRVLSSEAPSDLPELLRWMGHDNPAAAGKDLRRGLDTWRVAPVPPA